MPPNPGGGHPRELRIIGLHLEDEIVPGADLAACILHSLTQHDLQLADGDVLAVTQKVVSKAEGRLVRLEDVEPSAFARQIAEAHGRDARLASVHAGYHYHLTKPVDFDKLVEILVGLVRLTSRPRS